MAIPRHNKVSYPILQISSNALNHNLRVIKKKINNPNCKILIPLKANAYGCGLETLLPFFINNQLVDMLGVANPSEGLNIRRNKWKKPILLLGSFFENDIRQIFQGNITPCLTDLWQIQALAGYARKSGMKKGIHIKLDLGMGRLGISENQVHEMIRQLKETAVLKIKGIMTHFPKIERKDSLSQLKKFLRISDEIIRNLQLQKSDIIFHAANSYAILNYSESALDMVRPGLCFYGYFQTLKDKKKYEKVFSVKPSLRLAAYAFSQRILKRGSCISYNSTFKVKKDQYPVGVFPIGYADGIPIALSNRICFENKPLLGRVTMDQIILGEIQQRNQEVELLGAKSPPLEYWARCANTISYEIMTGLGQRLKRELVS